MSYFTLDFTIITTCRKASSMMPKVQHLQRVSGRLFVLSTTTSYLVLSIVKCHLKDVAMPAGLLIVAAAAQQHEQVVNRQDINNFVNRRLLRRQRVFRNRIDPMEKYNDKELYKRFRFRRHVIYELVDLLQDTLQHPTKASMAIPPVLQVLTALRFYATGTFQVVAGDTVNISTSSVCRCVRRVTLALCEKAGDFIQFPDSVQELNSQKAKMYSLCRFPNVIGAVDGSLIPILKPSTTPHEFICRKGYPAINLMIVCSGNNLVTYCSARWPGSMHDSRVFANSNLFDVMEGGINGVLLGDSGYPCRRYLLTPFRNADTDDKRRYNLLHSRTRVVVEQCFGVLKARFRCLLIPLRNSTPERSSDVILACVMLHNFGILQRDIYELTPEEQQLMARHHAVHVSQDDLYQLHEDGERMRQHYVNVFRRPADRR